ncbi:N(4)-acetylcytidine aminohydrolase [Enterovibrio sp. ZSDZ35]|uniref:N(4)-acetylcytidine amidohydrolase n=1 Tax=Enterovibrio qingdaonensis TaxID=2899818 RepID=A0ABT5QGL4_9GAMM|nr:N(4)-acetylcytidine aminohydrolase [Enterovibrio sp. ZSDZ35]MDD1780117.1 N(4)-acetylcytidine aminohydrolase [Enterovibrio sp. ZSDZ35]
MNQVPTKITFFEWLTPLVASGKKTITIRDESESHYVPGTRVDVHTLEKDEYVCQIDILKVEQISFDDINEEHAAQEFLPLDELKPLIRKIYPDDNVFYVISYKLVD